MTNNIPPIDAAASPPPIRPRRHLRLAAIGGIAAVAILGGGITAVASASAPTSSTSTVAPPTTGSAAPGGTAAPGTAAPGTGTEIRPERPTPKPHLDGTVSSVSGSTVLIKDRDGFTRTIVVSSKTTYADGLKAALASGAEIHAEGTVAANGTSLNATAIGKRPTPPAGGPEGGPGRGGPGGRGGHGGPPGGGPGGNGPWSGTGVKPTPPTGTAAPSTSSAAPTTS